MTLRIYLMPITGAGTKEDPRRAKYADTHLSGFQWQMMDYGDEPVCLVTADIGSGHAALAAETDVFAFPVNLDDTIGVSIAGTVTVLEGVNIPGNWIKSTHTFRHIIGDIAAMFLLSQQHQGLGFGRLFPVGTTLNTTLGTLTSTARQNVIDSARGLNAGMSSLDNSSQLRQILIGTADQLRGRTTIGGIPL